MRRIEPWTQVECETCGMPHMATRTQPLDLEDGVVLECPECAAYRRGHADGLREAEQAQRAEPKQVRACERCRGPGPCLWADEGRYLCQTCHPHPCDPFFQKYGARCETADALSDRISAAERQLDALSDCLREWGEARAAREAERKEQQR